MSVRRPYGMTLTLRRLREVFGQERALPGANAAAQGTAMPGKHSHAVSGYSSTSGDSDSVVATAHGAVDPLLERA
jgi:hypothetical protein